jgi:hypothetical protein
VSVANRCGLSWVLVVVVMVVYAVVVYLICRNYYENKVYEVSSVYEREMVRRARHEREHLDSVIVFIRESDSAQYWERVRQEIEYAKRVANGERR